MWLNDYFLTIFYTLFLNEFQFLILIKQRTILEGQRKPLLWGASGVILNGCHTNSISLKKKVTKFNLKQQQKKAHTYIIIK